MSALTRQWHAHWPRGGGDPTQPPAEAAHWWNALTFVVNASRQRITSLRGAAVVAADARREQASYWMRGEKLRFHSCLGPIKKIRV